MLRRSLSRAESTAPYSKWGNSPTHGVPPHRTDHAAGEKAKAMKVVCLSFAAVLTVIACGKDEPNADPPRGDVCTEVGQPCIRPGFAVEAGQCRAYAPDILTCCPGCWDAPLQFCQPGDVAGKCGVGGEDCSPERCK